MKAIKGISPREFIKGLENDGFVLAKTKGSHWIYEHKDGRSVHVAYKKYNTNFIYTTLCAMIKHAGWKDENDLIRVGLLKR